MKRIEEMLLEYMTVRKWIATVAACFIITALTASWIGYREGKRVVADAIVSGFQEFSMQAKKAFEPTPADKQRMEEAGKRIAVKPINPLAKP